MAVSKRLRYEILRRDNHTCRYCGATAPDAPLRVDHVIPRALGGTDAPTNLVTACEPCNSGKTSSLPTGTTVADIDQETFRQAAAEKRDKEYREIADHLWRGGYPLEWGPPEVERHAAEVAWNYAWVVASDGEDPSHEQYTEFLGQSATLFELGYSVAEIVCAAVHAGSQLTPRLSWGLSVKDTRNGFISGEQFSRMDGARDIWLAAWKEAHGTEPHPEHIKTLNGQLVIAVRRGYSRDVVLRAARSAAFAQNTDIAYFAHHITREDADEVEVEA